MASAILRRLRARRIVGLEQRESGRLQAGKVSRSMGRHPRLRHAVAAEGKATVEWAITLEPSPIGIEMYEGAGTARKRVMELVAEIENREFREDRSQIDPRLQYR
jgi:hypothetical protein